MSKTLGEKLLYSFLAGLLFVIASNPFTYGLVNNGITVLDNKGCPTARGHVIHTLIFFILLAILLLIMNYWKHPLHKLSFGLILRYSFYTSLMFYFMSNREMYEVVTGSPRASSIRTGSMLPDSPCVSYKGVFLQALIFTALKFLVMFFPPDPATISVDLNLDVDVDPGMIKFQSNPEIINQ
jgi:hypothetical protein